MASPKKSTPSARIQVEDGTYVSTASPLPVTGESEGGSLKIYELTMSSIGTFTAMTFTNNLVGITVISRSNTTTGDSPTFDIANTSTGSPFFRVPENSSYDDSGISLPTNSVMYFSVASQTNSVIQVMAKEL